MSLASCQEHWLAKWASEVGPAGQNGEPATELALKETSRSEAIAVK